MAPRTTCSTSAAHDVLDERRALRRPAEGRRGGDHDLDLAGGCDIRYREAEPGIEHGVLGMGKVDDDDSGRGIAEDAGGGESEPGGAAGEERDGSLDLLSTSR